MPFPAQVARCVSPWRFRFSPQVPTHLRKPVRKGSCLGGPSAGAGRLTFALIPRRPPRRMSDRGPVDVGTSPAIVGTIPENHPRPHPRGARVACRPRRAPATALEGSGQVSTRPGGDDALQGRQCGRSATLRPGRSRRRPLRCRGAGCLLTGILRPGCHAICTADPTAEQGKKSRTRRQEQLDDQTSRFKTPPRRRPQNKPPHLSPSVGPARPPIPDTPASRPWQRACGATAAVALAGVLAGSCCGCPPTGVSDRARGLALPDWQRSPAPCSLQWVALTTRKARQWLTALLIAAGVPDGVSDHLHSHFMEAMIV